MKTTSKLALWGTTAAIAMSAFSPMPAQGQSERRDQQLQRDRDRQIQRETERISRDRPTASRAQTGTLGNIERADRLIGTEVRTSDNERAGKIHDFVVDLESGRVLYVVVATGGVLGIGDRHVAVPPGAFSDVTSRRAQLSADRQTLTDAPQYSDKEDRRDEMRKVSFVSRVNEHFGQQKWWEGPTPAGQDPNTFGHVHSADDLMGMDVKNVMDADVGEINNLAIDMAEGRVLYVILTPDRSLDLRNNLFALPPNMFTPGREGEHVVADIDKEKLTSAPRMARNDWRQLEDPRWASQVYQHYGKRAYFETGQELQPTGRPEDRSVPQRDYDRERERRDYDRDRYRDRSRDDLNDNR